MKKYLLLTIIVVMQLCMAGVVWWASDKTEEWQIQATNAWMLMNALSWMFAFVLIAMISTGLFRELCCVLIILWIGNVIDEIAFDPTVAQWNDLVSLLIAYSIALVRITYHTTKNK